MRFIVKYKFKGKIHTEVFRANSKEELESLLKEKHFIVLSLTQKLELKQRVFQTAPKTKELLSAFYELKIGLKAHLSLDILLQNLQKHSKNRTLCAQFSQVHSALNSGKNLAQSFEEAGFSEFICAMLKVGQKANLLEDSLECIIVRLKNTQKNKKLLTKILLYPLVVGFFMVCVFLGITLFVLPQFEGLFSSIDKQLPLISQSLLFMRTMVLDYGLLCFAFVCFVVYCLWNLYGKNPSFRERLDEVFLKIPLLGSVLNHFEMVQFLLSFFWLYRAKTPLKETLEISIKSLNNLFLKKKAQGIFESILCGIPVGKSFCASGLFGDLEMQLLSAAHNEDGFLESLEVLLELQQEELKTKSEALMAWIEPVMILGLGGLVLWLALGIFLPLWELPLQMQMF